LERPDQALVVELLLGEPDPFPNQDASRPRYALDLRAWQGEGWPPAALLSTLPVHLPAPYERMELLDFIGIGGMGEVWLAQSADYPGQTLAVKFMTLPLDPGRPEYLAQFIEEVKAGLEITHEFLVRTHQHLDLRHAVADGWPPVGFVMQRHEVSLGVVIQDLKTSGKRLPQGLAVEWSRNLLDALETVHRRRRVHRDCKPSNVLLGFAPGVPHYDGPESIPGALAGSHALLSDLGTVGERGKVPPFPLGQDGFKAPELFNPPGGRVPRSDRPADPSEDLYAFGLILQRLAAVVDDSPEWLADVARELTAPDPARRPPATSGLRYKLSPDWRLQQHMIEGGWNPPAHPFFTGRDFVFEAFEQFCAARERQQRGGVFLIEG
jgi:hypothetical protein